MILPVPLAVIAAIALVWFALPRIIASNATGSAVLDGGQIANQFKIIRGYYTEAVVNKVVKDGSMKPSVDHKGDDKAIPRPATMIHDVKVLASQTAKPTDEISAQIGGDRRCRHGDQGNRRHDQPDFGDRRHDRGRDRRAGRDHPGDCP
jgi:hypothetical protein